MKKKKLLFSDKLASVCHLKQEIVRNGHPALKELVRSFVPLNEILVSRFGSHVPQPKWCLHRGENSQ